MKANTPDGVVEGGPGMNSAPGFKRFPRSHIATKPANGRVRVTLKGEVIADTLDALELKEGSYPAVYYLPRKDVRMDRLLRTTHSTYCPFKGHASYFSLVNGLENVVWSYEQPYDEMRDIKDLVAFFPDKVDSIAVTQG